MSQQNAADSSAAELDSREIDSVALAPRPKSIGATGLGLSLLADLLEKHLFEAGVATLAALAKRCALAGSIVEEVLSFLRKEGRIEVRSAGGSEGEGMLRYALTQGGRSSAQGAFQRSGYVGPAPVPLDRYTDIVNAQSVRNRLVTRESMRAAFADVVLDEQVLDSLGPALNSGKAIFVYGLPGTGKTYITQRLSRLLNDAVLVPYAIAVGDSVIQIFDPAVHVPLETADAGLRFEIGHDPRLVLCRRPLVLTGGELAPEMLEVQFDPATRQYRAPLQLKASNGMFLIDDLGRQRVAPQVLLNRWIVPMEEGRDYLSLATGQHFAVLFDMVLVFSTNLKPAELADEAFLRRIGYKIHFRPLQPSQYEEIWRQVCQLHGLDHDPVLCRGVVSELHGTTNVPLLPCHPRDLIDMALDYAAYFGSAEGLQRNALEWAWRNYFVNTDA